MIARAMTIAGSDSGGGAGIQADLKTFAAHRVYGMSAIAALTAQNTRGVQGLYSVDTDFIRKQIEVVVKDIGVDAIKTGMLASTEVILTVCESVKSFASGVPLVVDPVMVAKSGDRLLRADAIVAARDLLVPMASVLTPNSEEAAVLCGARVDSRESMLRAACALLNRGASAVLVKGGHIGGACCDDLFASSGGEREWFEGERLDQRHTHGTGCTLSAAIAANLAIGMTPLEACREAREYVRGAIANASPLGGGVGPVNHLWRSNGYRESGRNLSGDL